MRSVLIVDDSPLIRIQLKKFFEQHMEYAVAGLGKDGTEAISLFQEKKPDLVTLDLTMPNKDGIDALAEILEMEPAAKVFIISAIKDTEKINKALDIGAMGYITKPLDFNDEKSINSLKNDISEAFEN